MILSINLLCTISTTFIRSVIIKYSGEKPNYYSVELNHICIDDQEIEIILCILSQFDRGSHWMRRLWDINNLFSLVWWYLPTGWPLTSPADRTFSTQNRSRPQDQNEPSPLLNNPNTDRSQLKTVLTPIYPASHIQIDSVRKDGFLLRDRLNLSENKLSLHIQYKWLVLEQLLVLVLIATCWVLIGCLEEWSWGGFLRLNCGISSDRCRFYLTCQWRRYNYPIRPLHALWTW